ncbi:MAG TPA: hypothetical protein VM915_06740, partial [Verrucomicrobiae bacterium]|nr:hypothetical protein [Verrucomicrobiae bacterium]
MRPDITQATRDAESLKAEGRLDDAIAMHREIVAAYPQSRVARHNLACALGDAGYWADAEPIISAVINAGLDAPETWLVLARAQQAMGRLHTSEQSYLQVLRRTQSTQAHRELVQLRWMQGQSITEACRDLDAGIAAAPQAAALVATKAQVLMEVGAYALALALIAPLAHAWPNASDVAVVAAQAALGAGEAAEATAYATRAVALAPNTPAAHVSLIEALLNQRLFS